MRTLEAISTICTAFKEEKFDIEEFQYRLESIIVSDELKQSVGKARFKALNRLEEIRFCSLESNFKKYGVEVTDTLLEVVNRIKESKK